MARHEAGEDGAVGRRRPTGQLPPAARRGVAPGEEVRELRLEPSRLLEVAGDGRQRRVDDAVEHERGGEARHVLEQRSGGVRPAGGDERLRRRDEGADLAGRDRRRVHPQERARPGRSDAANRVAAADAAGVEAHEVERRAQRSGEGPPRLLEEGNARPARPAGVEDHVPGRVARGRQHHDAQPDGRPVRMGVGEGNTQRGASEAGRARPPREAARCRAGRQRTADHGQRLGDQDERDGCRTDAPPGAPRAELAPPRAAGHARARLAGRAPARAGVRRAWKNAVSGAARRAPLSSGSPKASSTVASRLSWSYTAPPRSPAGTPGAITRVSTRPPPPPAVTRPDAPTPEESPFASSQVTKRTPRCRQAALATTRPTKPSSQAAATLGGQSWPSWHRLGVTHTKRGTAAAGPASAR